MKLSTFVGTTQDPIATMDWLYEIKEKLDSAGYSEGESVQLVFRHLKGLALAWWGHFSRSHHSPENITWDELTKAFHEHHLPKDVMGAKTREIYHIRQGPGSIHEYSARFTRLLRYAPLGSASKKTKMYYFYRGLNEDRQLDLEGITCYTLNEAINRVKEIEKEPLETNKEPERKMRRTKEARATVPTLLGSEFIFCLGCGQPGH